MVCLNFATWNVRGLGDTNGREKRSRLKTWIHDQQIHVMVLQETKLNEQKIRQRSRWWKGQQYWSPTDGTKGGTAILLHRDLEVQYLDHQIDIWGQWLWVTVQIGDGQWTIATMYTPSEPAERKAFLSELPAILPDAPHLLVAGDFNTTLVPGLDSPEATPIKSDALLLNSFMEERGLVDAFRMTHPDIHGYTWHSSQKTEDRKPPKRRLDLVLAKGQAWNSLTSVEVITHPMSDHRPLRVTMETGVELKRGIDIFRLNTDLLRHNEILEWIKQHWVDWEHQRDSFPTEEGWIQMGFRIVTRALDDILTSRRPPNLSLAQLRAENDLWEHTTKTLLVTARLQVDRPVTYEELTEARKAMAKGKSPGSNGLPVEYYEATWDQIAPILVQLYNHILEGGHLMKDMRTGVITLIYKKGDKRSIINYRPISRLNVSYKLLSKLLARRLAPLLPELIHTDQGAFIQGRSIAENIFTAVGALEIIHRENRQVAITMLDLEKAYDRVNWSFVLATLDHMNFGPCYRRWVQELYMDTTTTILVNGHQSLLFSRTRSLRQGCPLASLPFAVQMEVLLNSLRASPRIRGLQLGRDRVLLTGAIADDLLLVAEAKPVTMREIKSQLDVYSTLSEAQVNWAKSVYNLPEDYRLEEDWGMRRIRTAASERYLGLQVSLTSARPDQDNIIAARTRAKLQACRAATGMSLFGRALVLNAVVFAQILYIVTIYLISKPTTTRLKCDAARYLWKPGAEEDEGYITKCAWDSITKPKHQGGLSVLDPVAQNLSLLFKWIVKAATQHEKRNWIAVFEYLAQADFHLKQPQHVWTCLWMDAYVRRQPASPLLKSCWAAWRSFFSQHRKTPATREEVLRQPLFDNHLLCQEDGTPFPATTSGGAFGRRWVEKGILTVADLWDQEESWWLSEETLRDALGRLHYVEQRRRQLIDAVPPAWQNLLQADTLVEGQWYVQRQAGEREDRPTKILLSEEQLTEEYFCAQEWTQAQQCGTGSRQRLTYVRQTCLQMEIPLELVRVHTSTTRRGISRHDLLLAGTPLAAARLDPLAEIKARDGGHTTCLCEFTTTVGRESLAKPTISTAEATRRLARVTMDPALAEIVNLNDVWTQLHMLPSLKFATFLWLLTHTIVPCAVWLFEKGMDLPTKCLRCGGREEETLQHLIWSCPASYRIWRWWNSHWNHFVGDALQWNEAWALGGQIPDHWFKRRGKGYVAQAIRSVILWSSVQTGTASSLSRSGPQTWQYKGRSRH
ncbi:hypothetical protein CBR_g29496 [Chara braunii]|uniref:Reverse transcriptase domain-containing protein n=1 Tax=Chara braunii TaxID=69332 RepID=A0A388LAN3_CHABU|nr:hypothetical protein CBR_g29496 [Chara braunii]|eukprot:GBG79346.1 hypothetical protein CBR_g29496 [Chara braunii]